MDLEDVVSRLGFGITVTRELYVSSTLYPGPLKFHNPD